MRISGYSWVGVRTEDFESTITFLADMLGLPLTWRAADGEIAHFRLPSGQLFEVFGPNDAGIQTTTCPVVGFEVADVWAARQALEPLGVQGVMPGLLLDRVVGHARCDSCRWLNRRTGCDHATTTIPNVLTRRPQYH